MIRVQGLKRVGVKVSGLALATVVLLGCMAPEESAALSAINQDRTANSRGALAVNEALVDKAQSWAVTLASSSGGVCSGATLRHSRLTDGAPAGWRGLAENVGCRTTNGSIASTVQPLEAGFMASTGHRINILNWSYTHGGVGMASVAWAGHPGYIVVFEVQEFAQL